MSYSNLLKLHQRQEWRNLMFHYKFPTSVLKNKGMAIVFVSPIGAKIQQNVVLRDVKETRTAIKLFLNLYLPTETYNLLQIAEESLEM